MKPLHLPFSPPAKHPHLARRHQNKAHLAPRRLTSFLAFSPPPAPLFFVFCDAISERTKIYAVAVWGCAYCIMLTCLLCSALPASRRLPGSGFFLHLAKHYRPASMASALSMSFCTNSSFHTPVKCSRSMTEKRLRMRWQLVIAHTAVFAST